MDEDEDTEVNDLDSSAMATTATGSGTPRNRRGSGANRINKVLLKQALPYPLGAPAVVASAPAGVGAAGTSNGANAGDRKAKRLKKREQLLKRECCS